jgi:hypothetical protein
VHRMRVRQVLNLAAVLGIALLVVLVRRTGTYTVIHQVKTIGWGFGLVLLLGGLGHPSKPGHGASHSHVRSRIFRLPARLRSGSYLRLSLFSDFLVK